MQPRKYIFTLCCWLLCITCCVTACGQNPSPAGIEKSATYIASEHDQLVLLPWQRTGDTLQGEWISHRMPDLQFFRLKNPTKTLWSGQIQDETTFSVTISGSLLQGKIEGNGLTLNGSTPSTGTFQKATWRKISQEQANQYTEAFEGYAQARLAFALLRQTVSSPPPESRWEWYARSVWGAQEYVRGLSEKRDQVEGLQRVCGTILLSQFWSEYPPASSEWVLSGVEKETNTVQENAQVTVEASTVWKQLGGYREAWKVAQGKPVPQVDGVSLPWRVDPQKLPWPDAQQQPTEASAQKLVDDLSAALNGDYQSMKDLKNKATEIGSQVEELAKRQGCARS